MQIKQSTIQWIIIFSVFFLAIYLVSSVLMPFIFGAIVAYFLDPVTDKLQDKGLSRNRATVTVLGIFLAIIIGIFALAGPLLVEQISGLFTKIPEYLGQLEREHGESVKELVNKYAPDFQTQAKDAAVQYSSQLLKISTSILGGFIASSTSILSFLSLVFISPIVAYYLLRDWDVIVKKIDDLLPRNKISVIRKNLVKIDTIISAYIRGQVTVCLIMAVLYSLNLTLAGLNYSLAIGVLTGILTFIPYVGMTIGALTGLIVAYMQFGFEIQFAWVVVAFLLGNLLEGNFITPKIVGESVELHPAWVIFALLAGGATLGFTGVLIAIPAAAVIGVLTRSSVEAYKESGLYLGFDNIQIERGTAQQEGIVTEKEESPIFETKEANKTAKTENKKAENKRPEKAATKEPRRFVIDDFVLNPNGDYPSVSAEEKASSKPKNNKPKATKKGKKKEPELKFPS
jgi:predicted PurR-regulated permease PerM